MEELQSALGNRGLTVLKVPEKGRGLFATRDFSPGEVILNQEPYISVPNNFSGNSNCDVCFGSGYVNYCSGTCQMSEWNLHRIECEALSKLLKENPRAVTPSLRLMVRLYCRSYLQSQKTIPTSDMDNFSLVDALVSHMWDIDEKQVVLYSQMANLISLILQQPDVDILEITENFSKFACNAHTICDRELKPLGTGLYPVISIINHSCLPNSVLLFDGRSAVVRAVQHIPKGAEVLISYIDTTGSTLTRQKALKEQYLFTCACPRCSNSGQYEDIQESAVLEGYQCENTKCDGILLPNSANSKEAKIDMGSQLRSLQVNCMKSSVSQTMVVRGSEKDTRYCSFSYNPTRETFSRVSEIHPPLEYHSVIGACNGLICLHHHNESGKLILWNPSLHTYKVIRAPRYTICKRVTFGFGYDETNLDYKIVMLRRFEQPGNYEVAIYSLKSDSWKEIQQNFPCIGTWQTNLSHVSWKGAVYWIVACEPKGHGKIVVFDFTTESFQDYAMPTEYRDLGWDMELIVLGDKLCVRVDYGYDNYMFYIVNGPENHELWTEFFKFKHQDLDLKINPQKFLVVLVLSSNEERILLHYPSTVRKSIFWFDHKTKMAIHVGTRGIPKHFDFVSCGSTLALLDCDRVTDIEEVD